MINFDHLFIHEIDLFEEVINNDRVIKKISKKLLYLDNEFFIINIDYI